MLADFLDMESSLIVTMHVQSVDQISAIKTIKRKITDLDRMKIEEQKKAVRSGYDMDIIPSDLATYGAEAKKLLQELQSRNERMFLLTFLVLNIADSVPKLRNNVFQASSIAQKYNCQLVRLDFRQEEGLMSSLPLGLNQVEIQRSLTTSAVAIFVPFTTQELYQNGSEALYCGLNALSNNLKVQGLNQTRSGGYYEDGAVPTVRNKRDVWQINPFPYKGGHFAAFPPKLVETCLLAGCPQDGIVLDPFLGSGTTAAVGKQMGRHYIGIELNPDYCALAEQRIGGVTE